MTKTDIANIALAKFREGRITDITSTTDPVAVVVSDQYDHALRYVLEEHRWNFAGKRAKLTELGTTPAFGWDHQYQLPADLIRIKEVNGEAIEESLRSFIIEGDKLLTNEDSVEITYVSEVTDPNLFSPSFIDALATKLAALVCARITGDSALAIQLEKQYELGVSKAILNDAKAVGGGERNLMYRMMSSSPILNVRGAGSRLWYRTFRYYQGL